MEIVSNQQNVKPSYPELEKICLLCLEENSGTVQIFQSGDESIPLRIMACTSLEVNSTILMPKMICRNCRIQLERFYYFRKRAQYSYNKLKKHIRLIVTGKKSRIFEKNDEDDDEIDFTFSLEFLKSVEEEEKLKRKRELLELEEQLKERFRVEETNRIFEEARNFLNNKASEYLKSTSIKLPDKIEEPIEESMEEPIEETIETSQDSIKQCIEIAKKLDHIISSANDNPELEADIDDEPCVNDLSDDAGEKLFKFAYSNTNDEAITGFYLMKNNEDEDIEGIPSQDNIEEIIEDTSNANALTIMEMQEDEEDDKDFDEQIETINLDECSLENTMGNSVNMAFEDKNEQDLTDSLIEETAPSLDEDESSNQSKFALAAVIQKSLLSQENLKLNGNIKFRVEQIADGITHVKVVTEEGNVIDIEVKNDSDTESLIEKNVAATNEELKIFKCSLCPQAFTRRTLLLRHKSVHVKSTGYCCKFCKKWFACKSSMNRHIRVHTGEKPFECDQCGRKFIQKEILKRHMVVHTGVRPYPCPHCDKAFVQKQLLRQHVNQKHTDNPVVEMHECFLCPKSFCHASGLSRHLLVHSGVSYQCKKCGKKFNDKSAVKRHTVTVHAKIKKDLSGSCEEPEEEKSQE